MFPYCPISPRETMYWPNGVQVYSVSPDRGPTTGGTVVTVSGVNISSAATHRASSDGGILCRFGGPGGQIVRGVPLPGIDAVECETPPHPGEDPDIEVFIWSGGQGHEYLSKEMGLNEENQTKSSLPLAELRTFLYLLSRNVSLSISRELLARQRSGPICYLLAQL